MGNSKELWISLVLLLMAFFGFEAAKSHALKTRGVSAPGATGESGAPGAGAKAPSLSALKKQNAALRGKLARLGPRGLYIVVDTSKNVLYLKKGGKVVRTATVSSGSGNVLEEPGGSRRWVFDTPRGAFTVNSRLTQPVWVRPDWAFIEEGLGIPEDPMERIESGVLGEYALGFGDGYFIHGTLYTRLLGRNVTHGCIRLGDEDLWEIFKATPVGTEVFIF